MKHIIIACSVLLATLSCSKEKLESSKPDQTSATEIEAIKQEVKELREKVESLPMVDQGQWVPASELEALKQENEVLKAQVEKLSSSFFEVDGLRFDLNGDIISTPVINEIERTEFKSHYTLVTNRTYDSEGRLLETYSEYTNINAYYTPPFYWQKVMYEYNGKTRKTTTQTHQGNVAGAVIEEVTETTYW